MKKVRFLAALVAMALGAGVASPAHAQTDDAIQALLRRVEQIVQAGTADAYLALLTDGADRARARDFLSGELQPGASRAIIQERDREALRGSLPDDGYRLIVDVFVEYGDRARVATWRLDVKRVAEAGAEREWAIADEERMSSLENLYRLALNASKEFSARDLKISAEDLDLTLAEGSVFVSEVEGG